MKKISIIMLFLASFVLFAGNVFLTAQPVVTVQGRSILVNDSVYVIRGICYNPVAIGDDRFDPPDFSHIDQDIQLMKNAGINTIRTYTPIMQKSVLDKFAASGIKVIIGFPNFDDTYQFPDINHGTYLNYINTYKTHDAILMWELGNEYNYHPEWFNNNISNWYTILNNAAAAIHAADPGHPVSTAHGEVPNSLALTQCSNVDVWGMNVYRWDNPYPAVSQFAALSSKPCYLSESGGDRYNNQQGAENQQNQSDADLAIWNSIKGHLDICSGIAFFSFVDEWWKSGGVNTQDPGGFAMSIPYDSYANEEWWGIVDINRNPTLAYHAIKNAFLDHANAVEKKNIDSPVIVYPNPARYRLYLDIPENIHGNILLSLTSITGQPVVIENQVVPDGRTALIINTENLSPGMYILSLTHNTFYMNKLVIINK